MHILVLNGPNLNLLGTWQPEVYGHETLADIDALCQRTASDLGVTVTCDQSNHEGVLIDRIHAAREMAQGIVMNAGAYTHTSVAIMDALSSVSLPVVELHLSNVHAREPFRHKSYLAPIALGVICGFGSHGYALALRAMVRHLETTA